MGPILEQCAEDYAGKSIEFITFDFTTGETRQRAVADADAHGVRSVFDEYDNKTGFLLLYDTGKKKVVERLSADDGSEGFHAAIDRHLGS